jgi:hypothetical protein
MSNIKIRAIEYREGTPKKNCGICAYYRKVFKTLPDVCLLWYEEETQPGMWCAYGSLKTAKSSDNRRNPAIQNDQTVVI